MTMFILTLLSTLATFISFLFSRRTQTKRRKCIALVLAVFLLFLTITLGWLSYQDSVETKDKIQQAQEQITEIRTPRRMEPETTRMFAARITPYAGQKYDMKVFRDEDSLELASAIQAILEDAGWVYTDVYPRSGKRYAETRGEGVFLMSDPMETRRTSKARVVLQDALIEAGLYDDSSAFTPINCAEITGPIQVGTQITPIPCSESSSLNIDIGFRSVDDVIPEDTLVLLVGKERL